MIQTQISLQSDFDLWRYMAETRQVNRFRAGVYTFLFPRLFPMLTKLSQFQGLYGYAFMASLWFNRCVYRREGCACIYSFLLLYRDFLIW